MLHLTCMSFIQKPFNSISYGFTKINIVIYGIICITVVVILILFFIYKGYCFFSTDKEYLFHFRIIYYIRFYVVVKRYTSSLVINNLTNFYFFLN